ncbi:MAG: endolytic transglycosylase MltG [Patescibacteria group bacterium]|nr:endolytic transglycosylase MltG [bacterium]MDZ4221682.1 endolytic transglycosylase MltG [Patescibacteria group bacterium]
MYNRATVYILAIAIVAAIMVAYIGSQFFGDADIPAQGRVLDVAPGATVKQISAQLSAQGAIKSDFWFRTLVWARQLQGSFLAGEFELPAQASSQALIALLTQKSPQEVAVITLLEGWGMETMAEYFEKRGMFPAEEWLALTGSLGVFGSGDSVFAQSLEERYGVLGERPDGAPLEGFLFPDTYEVFANASPGDIIQKMVAHFDATVTQDLREEIAEQGKDFYDVLIMASIIEAEVPHEEDRAIVSDIFWSRLAVGVALQSDATLNYAIKGTRPGLTLSQLEIDSPYNSYKYRGLPPTPIGNPGLDSIRAAVYPADTDYFYFLSTPEGETIFSRTLEEHNAAKARYLR